jgi:hypothetical protein
MIALKLSVHVIDPFLYNLHFIALPLYDFALYLICDFSSIIQMQL